MNPTLVFSFLSAAILLALMPGPDNIFVLTESITKGKRNGIAISTAKLSSFLASKTFWNNVKWIKMTVLTRLSVVFVSVIFKT